jgi:Fur family transcriptional regulator, zinc uptake regulator
MTDTPDLTRNQTLVLDRLSKTDQPMSAYTLLDELRGDGLKAPLQVYRALDKLVAQGRVHRLESISAFVACQHPDCQSHAATVFMICEKCGKVSEKSNAAIGRVLGEVARTEGFTAEKTSIEIRGACGKC